MPRSLAWRWGSPLGCRGSPHATVKVIGAQNCASQVPRRVRTPKHGLIEFWAEGQTEERQHYLPIWSRHFKRTCCALFEPESGLKRTLPVPAPSARRKPGRPLSTAAISRLFALRHGRGFPCVCVGKGRGWYKSPGS